MKVSIEKELDVKDAFLILLENFRMNRVVSEAEHMEVMYDPVQERNVVVDRRSGKVQHDDGDLFLSLMSLATLTFPGMDGRSLWEPKKWVYRKVGGDPKFKSRDDMEYFMCTVTLDGHTSVKPCWYGDGHWWYGMTQIDDYVVAWLPNEKPLEITKASARLAS